MRKNELSHFICNWFRDNIGFIYKNYFLLTANIKKEKKDEN